MQKYIYAHVYASNKITCAHLHVRVHYMCLNLRILWVYVRSTLISTTHTDTEMGEIGIIFAISFHYTLYTYIDSILHMAPGN